MKLTWYEDWEKIIVKMLSQTPGSNSVLTSIKSVIFAEIACFFPISWIKSAVNTREKPIVRFYKETTNRCCFCGAFTAYIFKTLCWILLSLLSDVEKNVISIIISIKLIENGLMDD